MKRLVTCALLLLVVAVVLPAADETKSPSRAGGQHQPAPRAEEQTVSGIRLTAVVQYVATETESAARQQLLERLNENVELMTDQEVQEAIETADREILVRKAKGKLDAARMALRQMRDPK
jgi:hypothetical protein